MHRNSVINLSSLTYEELIISVPSVHSQLTENTGLAPFSQKFKVPELAVATVIIQMLQLT